MKDFFSQTEGKVYMDFGMKAKERDRLDFIIELVDGQLYENKMFLIKVQSDYKAENSKLNFTFEKDEVIKLNNIYN